MVRNKMLRPLAILAMSLSVNAAGQAQDTNDEIHLRATVQAVVPLASFSGQIVRVDLDPRFALTVHVESADPSVATFAQGNVVTLAIHSPSLLFGGEAAKAKIYDLSIRHKVESGKTRFFGLKVLEAKPAANRAAGQSDRTPISVTSASVNGNVVLVDANMNGKPVQLECFVSQVNCAIPKPGNYILVRSSAARGIYMDCPNIDLYEQSGDSRTTKVFAEYCLLGDGSTVRCNISITQKSPSRQTDGASLWLKAS